MSQNRSAPESPQPNTRKKRAHRVNRKKPNPLEFEAILGDRLNLLHEILEFRHFLESGFEPKISDAEIIVMFVDVRGFTKYCRTLQREMQDRKIQNFLAAYVRIFTEGLLEWVVERSDPLFDEVAPGISEIKKSIIPSMYKNLGDGLMIAWEIPKNMDFDIQGRLTHEILNLADIFAGRFCYRFHQLAPSELDAYSQQVENLKLGFGIAKGHAWRLDFGHTVDYAGSIINLASRLEGFARPSGQVVTFDTSPWLLERLTKDKDGRIGTLKSIDGYDPVKVWVSREVDVSALPDFEPHPARFREAKSRLSPNKHRRDVVTKNGDSDLTLEKLPMTSFARSKSRGKTKRRKTMGS